MNQAALVFYSQFNDFFELTKPRIGLLVLITTYAGMYVASSGSLSIELVFFTLLGTGLASSASGALNNYIDRDVDVYMERTKNRALAAGRVDAIQVLGLGLALLALSVLVLLLLVNWVAAALAVFTVFFYTIIYTLWLKRVSPWCTEVGGVAGALPPVIGWSAVTGSIGWEAVILFMLMFLWQPPHFWALALLRCDEYKKAGLPMLPVVSGEAGTKRHMLLYTLTLLPVCLLIYALGIAGPVYLVVAIAVNLVYLVKTLQFCARPVTPGAAKELFGISIIYISVVFAMLFIDGL